MAASTSEKQVQELYIAYFGRPADAASLAYYVKELDKGTKDFAKIALGFDGNTEAAPVVALDADKYVEGLYQQAQGGYDYLADGGVSGYFNAEVLVLSAELEACKQLDLKDYETAWQAVFNADRALIIGQQEYGKQHKQRFWELVNAMGLLLQNNPAPRVLEFGVSEFSGLYGKLFPHMQFHTSDSPTSDDYIGFTEAVCKQLVGGDHLPLDLTDIQALNDFAQQQSGRFDLILLTEVLEHLCIHPVDILRPLIQALSSQGQLYLTTPNFFSLEKRQLMQRWHNPQEVYPAADGNWDAHHHHREYCLTELLPFIEQAGGCLKGFYYSSCWDQQPCDNLAERSNMVFVISAGSSQF